MSKHHVDKAFLLGLGFDCDDGHLRITKGKNFRVFGGSQSTHKYMQDKVMQFNECLDGRGKTLGELSRQEFYEIAEEIGFKRKDRKS